MLVFRAQMVAVIVKCNNCIIVCVYADIGCRNTEQVSENSGLITEINYILKYIKIENCYFKLQ